MIYRFEDYQLDTDAFELRCGGRTCHVEPQVFDVLVCLVENAHRIVPKQELLDRVWPEGFISDAALSSRITSARKSIGDSGKDQRLIRTIHGRGFRFVGRVETEAKSPLAAAPVTPAPDSTGQAVRFCHSRDGTRLAYASIGSGPPFVKAPNWITHLDMDLASPVWGHLFREIASCYTLIRHDTRGSGMSDWDPPEISFERMVEDLEAVVDELALERFPMIGISQGGAIAIEYALRHPEKVSHLVLHGAYAHGWRLREPDLRARNEVQLEMARLGWGDHQSSFSLSFAANFVPGVEMDKLHWLTDLQRRSATPANAVRILDAIGEIDVLERCARIDIPTLVLHPEGDQQVPYSEGLQLASAIPGARFVRLDSANHLILEDEPAWEAWRQAFWEFMSAGPGSND